MRDWKGAIDSGMRTIAVEEGSEDKGKRPWVFCRDYLVGVGDKFIEAHPISISNFFSSRVT